MSLVGFAQQRPVRGQRDDGIEGADNGKRQMKVSSLGHELPVV